MKFKKRLYNDYRAIKVELLKALRKDLSQQEISRNLGLSFNQYGKWETHQKQLKWSEFLHIAQLCHVIVIDPLIVSVSWWPMKSQPPRLYLKMMARQGIESLKVMAEELHTNVKTLQRWLRGSGEPELELILQLLDLNPGFLAFFCTTLLQEKVLPIFAEEVNFSVASIQPFAMSPVFL